MTRCCPHVAPFFKAASPPNLQSLPRSIQETENEAKILDAIRGTVTHHGLKTTPRVAGGWVRDKLMGRPSLDIDVALDDCSGEEFAGLVNAYLESKGEPVKSIGVIKANPDQSKHLATATVNVYGTMLDFVNLRSEVYAENSRIPVIEVGTPHSDAQRRDFTINALYYNVITRQVEDYTGQGLDDLKAGVLRTPIDARLTFRDDPLRMLRCIRFASRYSWMTLRPNVCEALISPEHHVALRDKVSNERVGIELMGALSGPHPALAIELILRHGLADAVFKAPAVRFLVNGTQQRAHIDWSLGLAVAQRLDRSLCTNDTFLAAALVPLHGLFTPNLKKKLEPTLKLVILESLKLKGALADATVKLLDAAHEFAVILSEGQDHDRLRIGRLVLDMDAGTWSEALRVAEALLVSSRRFSRVDADGSEVATRARALQVRIQGDWALDELYVRLKQKPVLDGKDVMRILGIKGAETKKALDLVRDFCILHPDVSDSSLAEAHLKTQWASPPPPPSATANGKA